MAEYWKSQPRKLCEFCKCWITDNKASVEFHERGKKHKENVQKRIVEVQKKGKETCQAQKQLKMDLAAIEAAALKAYEKDLNIEPSKSKSESSSEPLITQTKETCSKGESTRGCFISYEGGQPTMQCSHGWNIGQAPEGYYYYYNATTQASQWESPSCLSSPTQDNARNSKEEKAASAEHQTSTQNDKKESNGKEIKQKEAKSSPYGQWTTVQTFDPPPEPIKTAPSNGIDTKEVLASEADKTEAKFKERSTPKITFRPSGEGNEVAFKKRKLNPDKKRNIRQTDPNKVS